MWAYVGMLQALLTVLHLAIVPALAPEALREPPAQAESQVGRTLRWGSAAGPVRVWFPAGYESETAATVVYVHGYHRNADSVWTLADLPRQFAESGRNALFIVPTAAESDRSPMRWARLDDLFAHLAARGVERPRGPLILVGHSGAYRTVSRWVSRPAADVSAVILLDALYGGHAAFEHYVQRGRLAVVSHSTAPQAARFLARIPRGIHRAAAPDGRHLSVEAREARVLAMETTLGHAPLNDTGAFLPGLLGLYAPATGVAAEAPGALVTAAR